MSHNSRYKRSHIRQQVGKSSLLVGFLVLSLLVQSLGFITPTANAAGTSPATTSQPTSDESNNSVVAGSQPVTNSLVSWLDKHGSSNKTTATPKPQPKKPSKPSNSLGTTKPKFTPTATGSSTPNKVPLNTDRQISFPKNIRQGVQPKNTYPTRPVNVYYVKVVADDAGTATDCAIPTNTDCSLRSALVLASGDNHAGSANNQMDYIFLNAPYGYAGGGSSYNISNAYIATYNPGAGVLPFPQVPDYVAIFGDAQPCSQYSFGSVQNNFSLFYNSPIGSPALTLGNYDYLEGTIFYKSGDIGLQMAGTENTYTCGVVDTSIGDGVQVLGSNNQVGYDDQYGGDFVGVINGNTDGIVITGTDATYNTLSKVYVGYIPSGKFFTSGSGNYGNGVVLSGGSSKNCIGQSGTGLANVCPVISIGGISNVIAGNTDESDFAGVLIVNSSDNLLVNNYIGTDETGNSATGSGGQNLANDYGILIKNGSNYNQIGGSRNLAATSNYIGNNNQANVWLESDYNTLQGNYIGIEKDQSAGFDNGKDGIDLFSNYNTIGGDELDYALGNIISGNGYDNGQYDGNGGIVIGGSGEIFLPDLTGNNNTIEGNYIGTTANASTAISNTTAGIAIYGGSNNIIGAYPITQTANIIAGNDGDGIYLGDLTSPGSDNNNNISYNIIGTNFYGSSTLGNSFYGIDVHGGITTTISNNFIANNAKSGVILLPDDGTGTTNTANSVTSNYIGIAYPGTSNPLPNGTDSNCSTSPSEDCVGVVTEGANGNTISGNTVYGQTGFVSGNIVVDGSSNTTIQSNIINQAYNGIWLVDGASNNQIGGSTNGGNNNSTLGNTINSAQNGIIVEDADFANDANSGGTVSGNSVQGNSVGASSKITDTAIALIGEYNNTTDNTIGGALSNLGNTVENSQVGISLIGYGSYLNNNLIQFNNVGANNAGNSQAGIDLEGAQANTISNNTIQSSNVGVNLVTNPNDATATASGNTVNNNTITNNGVTAVNVGNSSTDNSANNTISQNKMSLNNYGIKLHYASGTGVSGGAATGPNNQAQKPVITKAVIDYGANPATLTIAGTANPNSNVELFVQDPFVQSNSPQGLTYLTTLTADASGNFSYSGSTTINNTLISTGNNNQLVATSTLSKLSGSYAGSTSEFSDIVNVSALPILTDNTNQISFSAVPGSLPNSANYNIQLSVQNAPANYSYSVSYSSGASGWLAVTPPSSGGTVPTNGLALPITVTTALAQGVYTATITFTDNSNSGDTSATSNKVTTVVYNVTPTPTLTASPSQMNFTATQGSSTATPSPQTLTLSTNSTVTYTVNTTYSASSNWVGGLPANGSTGTVTANSPVTSNVTVNPNGFVVGVYTATVTYTDNNNPSDVAVVQIVLQVNPAQSGSNGVLNVSPTQLTYTTPQNTNPAAQSITLTATNASVNYTSTVSYAAGNGSWLTISPTTGTVSTSAATNVSANVTVGGLSAGTYTATVSFYNTSNISDSVKTVTVVLNVTAGNSGPHIYYLPFLANQASSFTTYLVFQNIGTTKANVSIQYYDVNGNPITTPSGTCATVPQYGECLPPNPFAAGAKGSAVLTSDQSLTVLVSEATPYGGSSYPVNEGTSSSLVAPLAINNFYGGFVTQLTVGNFGTSSTSVSINFYDSNGNVQTGAAKNLTIAAHTSVLVDQSASNSGLPQGFTGWAQITGSSGSQLVAQVLEQNPNNHFVALANSQFTPQATVYAPGVFNNAFGGFYSGANIINPNGNSVTVNITYYDSNGNSYPAAAFTLAAHGVVGVYQGDTNTTHHGLPASGLPSNFYGGAVVSASGGGVVMVVNEAAGLTSSGSSRSGTYGAVLNGANVVGLPAVANNGNGFTSGVTVFNTSNQAVTGQIQYYDLNGNPVGPAETFTVSGQNSTLSPHAEFIAYQGSSSLPDGYYGTAVVTKTSGPDSALILTTNMQSSNFFYTYSEPSN